MQKELQALETNQIWIFINLPKGKKAIRCKWIYKVKCKPTGEVDRYKARLVAKEYNQIEVSEIDSVKHALDSKFTIKDVGHLKYFLALEIARSDHGIVLSQKKFVLDIITDVGLTSCPDSEDLLPCLDVCRRLIGSLLYVNITRLDISHAVQHLSQFMAIPRQPHMAVALHILRKSLTDLQISLQLPIDLKCDNKATLSIIVNLIFHERIKHIDIDCHIV
ncbi:uncharacterized protein LOC110608393 [Manihot esculenta]|uniref:uncharacterized protein LOC110608393 n=1 Tax=Manihot esculenta TaxID=3983 RepID=UPI000B5D8057|nr:uncharacterized protein LOC110608393 [Manihot esculenta]